MAGRDTGESRKRLSGPEAAPYLGFARKLMGMLKEQMAFNKLQQLSWTKDFANGVRITVASVFGLDEIRITVPTSVSEGQQKKGRTVKSREPVIVGVYHKPYPDTNAYVFLWKKGVGAVDISTGVAEATHYPGGISADGNTIAYSAYANAWGMRAIRWTNVGIEYMDCTRGAWVSGISADGSVICGTLGFSQEANQRGFRWPHGKPYEQYEPASGDLDCRIWDITPDGRLMAGQTAARPCYWVAGNPNPVMIDLPAGYTDEGEARGISADGKRIVGYAVDYNSFTSVPFLWEAGKGSRSLGTIADYDSVAGTWGGSPVYISDDGKTVEGTLYRSADGAKLPFRWTDAGGMVPIAGGNFPMIFSISQDASIAVGSSFVGSKELACLWDTKGFAFLDDPTGLLHLNISAADLVTIVEHEIFIPE